MTRVPTTNTISDAQREVLTALTTSDGWTDHGIDRKRTRGHRYYFTAFVGQRKVAKRTLETLASAGLVKRSPGCFVITDAGRAAIA